MIIASPPGLNAKCQSKWAELRFAVFLTPLFFIHCMHIESIHYDTTPGIIITLVGKDVGVSVCKGGGSSYFVEMLKLQEV